MGDTIYVSDFKGLTDLPAYNRDPGWLRTLKNLRPRPNGFLEMRGGLERLQPSGGTPVNPISAAGEGYLGAIVSPTPWGWVRTFDNSVGGFSLYGIISQANIALLSYFQLYSGTVGDYLLFGSDKPFSSVTLTLARAAAYGVGTTFVYEYGVTDPAGGPPTYQPLTMNTVFDWTTAVPVDGRATTANWAMPPSSGVNAWIPTTEGTAGQSRQRKYHVRVTLTAINAWVTSPRHGHENVHSDWTGMHELYVAGGQPTTSAITGELFRYVENVSTADWTGITATLFAGNSARQRMVSYRGVIYLVNGQDQKRFNGITFSDVGLPAPSLTFVGGTIIPFGVATTWSAGAAGPFIFRYAATSGWGSQQVSVERTSSPFSFMSRTFAPTLFGESPPQFFTAAQYPLQTAAGVGYVQVTDAQEVRLPISAASFPSTEVDAVHIYRTDDLTLVPESSWESMPYFRIFSIYRDASGFFIGGGIAGGQPYPDQRLDHPFPKRELDQDDTSPPPRCKFIWIHKNRNFYANSDRYPARVWWSEPFEPDVVRTDVNYEDFSTVFGGRVTAGAEFHNMSIVFTEDQMYGIADVDVDQFQSFPIAPGLGCIAPDGLAIGNGVAIWPAKMGFFLWSGEGLPIKISTTMDDTFNRLSYEAHGGSRAVIHNQQYEIRFYDLNGNAGQMWRFDILTGKWFEVVHGIAGTVAPMAVGAVPLGHSDYPRAHPYYGQLPGGSDFNFYVGEQTTQDNGSAIVATADVHFGPMGTQLFVPDTSGFYYVAPDGWGTPAVSVPSTSAIGTDVSSLGTGTPDNASDYSVVQGTFPQTSSGSQDVVVRFQVSSIGGGTIYRQRVLAAFLTGSYTELRRPV